MQNVDAFTKALFHIREHLRHTNTVADSGTVDDDYSDPIVSPGVLDDAASDSVFDSPSTSKPFTFTSPRRIIHISPRERASMYGTLYSPGSSISDTDPETTQNPSKTRNYFPLQPFVRTQEIVIPTKLSVDAPPGLSVDAPPFFPRANYTELPSITTDSQTHRPKYEGLGFREKLRSLIPTGLFRTTSTKAQTTTSTTTSSATPISTTPSVNTEPQQCAKLIYDPMAPYENPSTLEDINSRIIHLKNYLPDPIVIPNNPKLTEKLNNNTSSLSPRAIIRSALSQLDQKSQLNHPYTLIFSFHKFTPPPNDVPGTHSGIRTLL